MFKYVLSMSYIYLLSISFAFAERSQYMDLSGFLKNDKIEQHNDIGYIHMVPQFEKNMDPNRAITLELFFGEYDGSEESIQKLEYIKSILADEKKLNPKFKPEIIAISNKTDTLKKSKDLQNFLKTFKLEEEKVKFDKIPHFLDYSTKLKKQHKGKRVPSSLKVNGRKIWTLVRFSSVMAGTYASLYFLEGTSAHLAANVAFWPGVASAGITYFNNSYGAFMTNGRWANWLMESDNFFTRNLRKSLGINPLAFKDALMRNRDFFRAKYPTMYNKNPDLFERDIHAQAKDQVKKSKDSMARILARLKKAEEYFKWWVTEVAFTSIAIKLPQSIAGISEFGSIYSLTGDILMGSTMGLLAQGPGDIAIQVRKYQMLEELKQKVQLGTTIVENPAALLAEIEKVQSKKGEFKSYLIHDGSHKALVRIENWARSRSTLLAIFAVSGVGMEIAGIPLARPLLIGIGTGGALYYSSVQGWIKPREIMGSIKNYVERFRNGEVNFSLQFLKTRMCSTPYMLKAK